MEAYLDSLLYRTADGRKHFDLIITDECELPEWLSETTRLSVVRYEAPPATGLGLSRLTAEVIRQYLSEHDPARLRQITQPRWHAPGVLLGSLGTTVETCTRASESLLAEYLEAPSRTQAWLANNVVGRSVFFADRLYTPRYGGLAERWWAPAKLVVKHRVVNMERFSPDSEPRPDLFEGDSRRVLTVGRVTHRKGIDLLLAVAERLPDYEFVIVGPVSNEELAATAADLANVTCHPPVEYVEMPGLYTAADLVLSVSRLEWGGVSRAMLEGKAAGRPVVALDRGEAAAVADSVVPSDPDAIAAAVERRLNYS